MIKNLLAIISLTFIFSGCFSLSSLNPFSDDKDIKEPKELTISENAPSWVKNPKEKNYITSLGYSFIKEEEPNDFDKKRALLLASNKLSNEIFAKVSNFYKEYEEKLSKPMLFDKDIKNLAQQISLKALSNAKIKNSWLSDDNTLFVKIAVETDFLAEQIQKNSKQIYETDKSLYQNILSNRAKAKIINYLEK